MWSDWLVSCDCGFSLSALWCPLLAPTFLLGFLLPWTWVSFHSCSSKAQPPLLTLDVGYLLIAAAPDLGRVISPVGHSCASQPLSSFYIWMFSVHVLLKPSLKDYEHNVTSTWNECNCVVVWTFFPILLFSSMSLHWSFRKAFLSLLASLWISAFRCVYLFFAPLPFASLLFSAICKASLDIHFPFLHFFLLGMVLITASCTVLRNPPVVLQALYLSDLIPWIYFHSHCIIIQVWSRPFRYDLNQTRTIIQWKWQIDSRD